MEQGQATVEYSALSALAVVAACALVGFATPVADLAAGVVHAFVPRAQHVHRQTAHPSHHPRRRTVHPCLCPAPWVRPAGPAPSPTTPQSPPPADD